MYIDKINKVLILDLGTVNFYILVRIKDEIRFTGHDQENIPLLDVYESEAVIRMGSNCPPFWLQHDDLITINKKLLRYVGIRHNSMNNTVLHQFIECRKDKKLILPTGYIREMKMPQLLRDCRFDPSKIYQ